MSASPQTLQLAVTATGSLPGPGVKASANQLDTALSEGFGPALGEAFTTLTRGPGEDSLSLPADHPLADLLQILPAGGKLLPLLEQAMDTAAAAGIPAQDLVDRVAVRLEELLPQAGLGPVRQVAEAIRQVISELATVPASATQGIAASAVATQGAPRRAPAQAQAQVQAQAVPPRPEAPAEMLAPPPADKLPRELVTGKLSLEQQPAGLERALQQTSQALAQQAEQPPRPLKLAGLEQAMMRLQEASQPVETRQTELAGLLAAFRRTTPEARGEVGPRSTLVAPAAAAAVTAPAPSVSQAAGSLPTVSVNTPFGQPNWDQAVGERIQWMVSQKVQGAEVRLNPAHLGPMEVRVQVQNDQASVYFTAHHGAVREALEAALPRLRDMFEAAGVELVDVDISGQSFAEQRAAHEDADADGGAGEIFTTNGEREQHLETVLAEPMTRGMLDLFA